VARARGSFDRPFQQVSALGGPRRRQFGQRGGNAASFETTNGFQRLIWLSRTLTLSTSRMSISSRPRGGICFHADVTSVRGRSWPDGWQRASRCAASHAGRDGFRHTTSSSTFLDQFQAAFLLGSAVQAFRRSSCPPRGRMTFGDAGFFLQKSTVYLAGRCATRIVGSAIASSARWCLQRLRAARHWRLIGFIRRADHVL